MRTFLSVAVLLLALASRAMAQPPAPTVESVTLDRDRWQTYATQLEGDLRVKGHALATATVEHRMLRAQIEWYKQQLADALKPKPAAPASAPPPTPSE